MSSITRHRVLGVLLLGAWAGLLARAFFIQVLEHEHWEEMALRRQGDIEPIAAVRGSIGTSDGTVLARSVSNRSLSVDPARVSDSEALAAALEAADVLDSSEFLTKLRTHSDRRFLWVERGLVPEQAIDPLLDAFPSLQPHLESKRLYPLGRASGSIVGVMSRDDEPLGGLEHALHSELAGTQGSVLQISDRTGRRFQAIERHVIEDPSPGHSVIVSLHSEIQEIATASLRAAIEEQNATSGFVIVTRPKTGEILGLVTLPAVDPNEPATWNSDALRVRPVTDAFEPGSVFKIVAFAAALETGKLTLHEKIDCMDGVRPVPGGRPIRDHEPYEVIPAWEVMAVSSNIGTGVIAERVGAEGFHRMERSFGFGLPSGIDIPGEGRGRIPDPSAWSGRSLITMAFGQEVSATGIQLAMAFGAVANDGLLMRPLLVREVRDVTGRLVEETGPEIIRRVMRTEVAAEMRGLLRGVVTDGTAEKAEVEAYGSAGKTGTAQKYISELGRYSKERYVASFIGFAPWNEPEVLCVVVLDEPRGNIYGGNVAAPVFRRIVEETLPLLRERPVAPGPLIANREHDAYRGVPPVEGLTASIARTVVLESGFLPRFEGSGDQVARTRPSSGARLLPGGVVTMELETSEDGRRMPDLSGLSLRDALLRVRGFAGVPEVHGSGWVVNQSPSPGGRIEAGTRCRIELSAKASEAWKEFLEVEKRSAGELAHRADPSGS